MVPVLIAPHGGTVGGLPVQRTFATAWSFEFDAVLLAGAPVLAPDALPGRDTKAGAATVTTAVDSRVLLLVDECWRHAKVIGAWGAGATVLEAAGVADTPGVVSEKTAAAGGGPPAPSLRTLQRGARGACRRASRPASAEASSRVTSAPMYRIIYPITAFTAGLPHQDDADQMRFI